MCPENSGEDFLSDLPVRIETFGLDGAGTNPLVELGSLWAIGRAVRGLNPDVVFTFNPKTNLYGLLGCKLLGIPCIPNVSGVGNASQLSGWKALAYRAISKLAYKSASHVFFQNDADLKEFQGLGVLRDGNFSRLPGSGVDLDRFRPASKPASKPFIFLMACRLIKQKGVVEYLKAAEAILERFGTCEFWLAGVPDSSKRAVPEQVLNDFADRGVIRFLGNVSEMNRVIQKVDCVVLPSWYPEGVPRILLEGAASGKPLITTNRPGCRDVVIEGRNGHFVEAESVSSLVEVMERVLLTEPEKLVEMGFESRRLAEDIFDEQIVIEKYLALSRQSF